MDLEEALNAACEHLPDGWEIAIVCRNDEMEVKLTDPDCDEVEICDDDSTLVRMIRDRIDHALVTECQPPRFDPQYEG